MKEKKEFDEWIKKEKEKGLIDIKLYPVNTDTAETEEIYDELNSMNRAIDEKRYIQITDL